MPQTPHKPGPLRKHMTGNQPPNANGTMPGGIPNNPNAPIHANQLFAPGVLDKSAPKINRVSALFRQLELKQFPRDKGMWVETGSSRVYVPQEDCGTVRFFNPKSGMVVQVGEDTIVLWHFQTGTPGRGRSVGTTTILHAVEMCISSGSHKPLLDVLGK